MCKAIALKFSFTTFREDMGPQLFFKEDNAGEQYIVQWLWKSCWREKISSAFTGSKISGPKCDWTIVRFFWDTCCSSLPSSSNDSTAAIKLYNRKRTAIGQNLIVVCMNGQCKFYKASRVIISLVMTKCPSQVAEAWKYLSFLKVCFRNYLLSKITFNPLDYCSGNLCSLFPYCYVCWTSCHDFCRTGTLLYDVTWQKIPSFIFANYHILKCIHRK